MYIYIYGIAADLPLEVAAFSLPPRTSNQFDLHQGRRRGTQSLPGISYHQLMAMQQEPIY